MVAHALLGSAEGLAPRRRPLAEGRSYERLLELPDVEAWLIRWVPGAALDLHDHGGSSATVAVLQGSLVEHHRLGGGGRLRTRVLATGDAVSFGPDHAHAVANPGAVTAASIHVYSPPLAEMHFPDVGLQLDPSSPGWATPVRPPEPSRRSSAAVGVRRPSLDDHLARVRATYTRLDPAATAAAIAAGAVLVDTRPVAQRDRRGRGARAR